MIDVDRMPGGPRLFGRRAELAALAQLLGSSAADVRGAVLEGEAGIGKSTVWAAGIELALSSMRTVLSTRGSQSETGLSFAGLTDLLDPVLDEVIDELAEPQRLALEVALVRRVPDGVEVGPRELAAGVLAALRALCARGPVLIAIDDLQWVDRETLEAVQFAARRLDRAPLRILAARRTGGGVVAAPASASIEGLTPLAIGPMDAGVVRRLLTDRLDLELPDRVIDTLVTQTGGNPFWALELATTLRAGTPGGPIAIPSSLAVLVSQRLDGLSAAAREALLVVSALPQPTITLAVRALESAVPDPTDAIDAAASAGAVVESGGRLRPAHPLLGSAALEALPPFTRTQLHARLASVVDDDEQRARHAALAARECPDESVAARLDAGAVAARSRGATHAAAELADQAMTFTPVADGQALARRATITAELYSHLGETDRAEASAARAWRLPGVDRRRVLPMLVEATYWQRGVRAAQEIVISLLDDKSLDLHTRAVATALAADVGDGKGTPRGVLAQAALDLFDQVDGEPDPVGLSAALIFVALARLDAGDGIAVEVMDRAAEIQRNLPYVMPAYRADITMCWYHAVEELDRSRAVLTAAIADAIDHGEELQVSVLYGHLAFTELWAGRLDRARQAIDEGRRHSSRAGGVPPKLIGADALLRMVVGDVAGARGLITELAGRAEAYPDLDPIVAGHLRGLLALNEGDTEEAATHLWNAYTHARDSGIHEPGRRQHLEGDLGRALVAVGRLDDAAELAKELLALGERSGRPLVLGVGLRIHGLVQAERGDLNQATETLRRAVAAHEQAPVPLALGRTLIAYGQVCRRQPKRRAEGVQALQRAVDCFTEMGATALVDRAQAELDRGQRTRTGALLTAAEQQVAELVAGGATNREAAARLFTSVRTVEGHLAVVYRKVGVRSRTELAKRYNAGGVDG